MYCVKCGVELADSEKKCPLCGTPVFHPDIPRNLSEPPFPPDKRIRPEDRTFPSHNHENCLDQHQVENGYYRFTLGIWWTSTYTIC